MKTTEKPGEQQGFKNTGCANEMSDGGPCLKTYIIQLNSKKLYIVNP